MNHAKIRLFVCLLVTVLTALLLRTGVAEAALSPHCGASRIVACPNTARPSVSTSLHGIATISANDIWAVGNTANGVTIQTLTEHWDGTNWSIVPSPSMGETSTLEGVAAVSTTDVWAVGSTNISITLIEHWDGMSWSIIPSPHVIESESILFGVAAVSTNDVWAVGMMVSRSHGQALIEHWDGTNWSIVPSPNVAASANFLQAVATVSTNDVWAVGGLFNHTATVQTLTEHWDGTSWSVVPSPNVASSGNLLQGVATVSTNDVWAVGKSSNATTISQTLIEHWDGTSWSIVPSPNSGSSVKNVLNGIAAVSADDIWTVGDFKDSSDHTQTLTEHWDGTSWSIVPSPNVGGATVDNELDGVATVASNDVWTVGLNSNGSNTVQALIEHWDGSTWSIIPPGA